MCWPLSPRLRESTNYRPYYGFKFPRTYRRALARQIVLLVDHPRHSFWVLAQRAEVQISLFIDRFVSALAEYDRPHRIVPVTVNAIAVWRRAWCWRG